MFTLTAENYYTPEANRAYMSTSQFKDFEKCEAMALAKLRGEYAEQPSEAMLVGSYVDAHFSHTLDQFKALHPEIFTKSTGALKAAYVHAEKIILRIERDPYFMENLSGESQVVMTGFIADLPFKIRMDSYFPGQMIVDLKVIRDFKPVYVDGEGKLDFVRAWGYDLQGAIYRAVEGHNLPFRIAAATKQKPEPDISVIELPDWLLTSALRVVENKAVRFQAIKEGLIEPTRCEKCDYCKRTKVLTGAVLYDDFVVSMADLPEISEDDE